MVTSDFGPDFFGVLGVKWAFFDPPSIRAKIARSIRHIMPVPTMLQTQKNSSGKVVNVYVKNDSIVYFFFLFFFGCACVCALY